MKIATLSIRRVCRSRGVPLILGFLFLGFLLGEAIQPASAFAFHSGGVGQCSGCHAIHSPGSGANNSLLLGSDPSSICLNCHAGRGGLNSPSVFSPDGSALTPGGDFYWLTRSFSWLGGQSPADSHGHNVVAADFNLFPDTVLTQAPGGSYPAADLGCTSCHDPHGRIGGDILLGGAPVSKSGSYGEAADEGSANGSYRLLGGVGYRSGNSPGFQNDAPVARQSSVSRFQESDQSHVDYGTGMSEWCGNCHAGVLTGNHQLADSTSEHPSGSRFLIDQDIVSVYNSYVRTGNLSGTAATAYLQFVPFERGTANVQLLDPHSTQGPNTSANIMCLSCHRAHASAFADIGRWDFTANLLVDSHPAAGDGGATANDVHYSYYGRDIGAEFGAGQGRFCEKCHGSSIPN